MPLPSAKELNLYVPTPSTLPPLAQFLKVTLDYENKPESDARDQRTAAVQQQHDVDHQAAMAWLKKTKELKPPKGLAKKKRELWESTKSELRKSVNGFDYGLAARQERIWWEDQHRDENSLRRAHPTPWEVVCPQVLSRIGVAGVDENKLQSYLGRLSFGALRGDPLNAEIDRLNKGGLAHELFRILCEENPPGLEEIRADLQATLGEPAGNGESSVAASRHVSADKPQFNLPAIVRAARDLCAGIRARCPIKGGPPVETGTHRTFDSDVAASGDLMNLNLELSQLLNPDWDIRIQAESSAHIWVLGPQKHWHSLSRVWEAYMRHFDAKFLGMAVNSNNRTWMPGHLPEFDPIDLEQLEQAANLLEQSIDSETKLTVSKTALESLGGQGGGAGELRGHCAADSQTTDEIAGKPQAIHSDDFRSVNWFGTPYEFTVNQAKCVEILREHWERGRLAVAGDTIIERSEISGQRIDLVFRDHAAWGTMIVSGSTKGMYRLADPNDSTPRQSKPKRKKTSQRTRK